MLKDYINFISSEVSIKVINVVINKRAIIMPTYPVLENALKYNVQRIENDMVKDPQSKFIIISDEGRIGNMRKICRKVRAINYIQSQFNKSFYRQDIRRLLEDPLPKKSSDCHFVQCADVISYLVYLYSQNTIINSKWANRLKGILTVSDLNEILTTLKPIFNLKASKKEFGFVIYPKMKNTTSRRI